MQGEICVAAVMIEAAERRQRLEHWQARMQRVDLRREEQAVLHQWWQATEKDRPEIASRNREVFTRIRANKQRAHRIEQSERAILDTAMRREGYAIRPGRVFPRYVRPERLDLYPASVGPNDDPSWMFSTPALLLD
jgi:hypothetical protein